MPTPESTTRPILRLGEVSSTSLTSLPGGTVQFEVETDRDSFTLLASASALTMLGLDMQAMVASEAVRS